MRKSLVVLAGFLILTGAGCGGSVAENSQNNTGSVTTATPVSQTTTSTIMVPENIEKYQTEMTRFAQTGGEDPLKTTTFVQKEIIIPVTEYKMRLTAEAAANAVYKQGGGPAAVVVNDLALQDGTAYVLLNINTDAWAGVSVAQAIVHPVVAKTLGQFEGIKKITFGPPPGKY